MPAGQRSIPALAAFGRYARTLRHLRPSQVLWRLAYKAKRLAGSDTLPFPVSSPSLCPEAMARLRGYGLLLARHWPQEPASVDAIRAGNLEALNARVHASETSIPWAEALRNPCPGRNALHYFEYVRELALANPERVPAEDVALARNWMRGWVEHYRDFDAIAWDPFQVSCRLLNWAVSFALWPDLADDTLRASYVRQARFLADHLELHIQANHLYKDVAALVAAQSLIGEVPEKALAQLRAQFDEQIHADGGHYECSPMYHAHVLEDTLVAYTALAEKPAWLRDGIAAMTDFLEGLLHPDGEIDQSQ